MKIVNWEEVFFLHRRIVLTVNRVEFLREGLSHIVLRGRWPNIIVVNMHSPGEEKSYKSNIIAGIRTLPEITYEKVTRKL